MVVLDGVDVVGLLDTDCIVLEVVDRSSLARGSTSMEALVLVARCRTWSCRLALEVGMLVRAVNHATRRVCYCQGRVDWDA